MYNLKLTVHSVFCKDSVCEKYTIYTICYAAFRVLHLSFLGEKQLNLDRLNFYDKSIWGRRLVFHLLVYL